MAKEKVLIHRIETVRANSVTDKEFREFWGESREEAVKDMMEFVRGIDAEMDPKVYDKLKEWAASKKGRTAALKVARDRQKKLKTLAELLAKAAKMRRHGDIIAKGKSVLATDRERG